MSAIYKKFLNRTHTCIFPYKHHTFLSAPSLLHPLHFIAVYLRVADKAAPCAFGLSIVPILQETPAITSQTPKTVIK